MEIHAHPKTPQPSEILSWEDSPEEIAAQFEKDGFYIVKNVLPPSTIRKWRSILMKAFQSEMAASNANSYSPVKKYDTVVDLFVKIPQLVDHICNSKVVTALEAILGKNFLLLPDSSAHLNKYGPIHTDTTTQELKGFTFHHNPDYRIITLACYLQDNDQYGGGPFIVPGSHLGPDPVYELYRLQEQYYRSPLKRVLRKLSLNRLFVYENLEEREFAKRGFDVPSQAGDIVIFHKRCLHRSSFSKTQQLSPYGGRMAMFSRCSRNNAQAFEYIDYLKTKENALYDYLRHPRDISSFESKCKALGFTAL